MNLSYQHQAHAANLSDFVKHLCLSAMRHKTGLQTIWDAYAADPVTPWPALATRHAMLNSLLTATGPALVSEFQQTIAACRMPGGEPAYPGSSAILADFVAVRTLLISDSNPRCIKRQQQWFVSHERPRVELMVLDSPSQAQAALGHRPDLVFIDPPFLNQQEWDGVVSLLGEIRRCLPQARIVLWYPLRDDLEVPASVMAIAGLRLRVDYAGDRALKGCVLSMLNFQDDLSSLMQPLADWLASSTLPGIREVQLSRP